MAGNAKRAAGISPAWRMIMWGAAACILLLPAVAMQFTAEVAWDLSDFILFAAMLAFACGAFELAARLSHNVIYRAGAAVALTTVFLLVWVNGAVGIIGNENNPANLMYGGVLAVVLIGSLVANFRPSGMARALFATALAQVLVAVIAIIGGAGKPLQLMGITVFFVALWLVSAGLFRRAARRKSSA